MYEISILISIFAKNLHAPRAKLSRLSGQHQHVSRLWLSRRKWPLVHQKIAKHAVKRLTCDKALYAAQKGSQKNKQKAVKGYSRVLSYVACPSSHTHALRHGKPLNCATCKCFHKKTAKKTEKIFLNK